MKGSKENNRSFLLLGGAVVLIVLSVSRLPSWDLRAPSTPLDRVGGGLAAPAFRLLSSAANIVPKGASVAARSEPNDPIRNTDLHRLAVALLPARKVYPLALWGKPMPWGEERAEFLIVLGPRPTPSPGVLLLEKPEGTIWKRKNS